MKRLCWPLAMTWLCVACGTASPEQPTQAAAATVEYRSHATLAQMMRAIPFPSSNLIFDTQTSDPGVPRKPAAPGAGATESFSGVYGGWQAVENAALALTETGNLLLVPGRMCENGRPAPLEREDYRRFAQGLVDAGHAAYTAAQSRSLDAMVEVSGTVSDACAACHEVYRDKDNPKDRCVP